MQSAHRDYDPPAAPNMASGNPDEKVLADLATLSEQIALCQSMLANAGGSSALSADEALLTVIGFLEACAPRVVELIEAAAQGALTEATFEQCLVVNDALTNVLADVDKEPKDRQPPTLASAAAAPTEAGAGAGAARGGADAEVDRRLGQLSVAPAAAAGGNASGGDAAVADDPFGGGLDLLAPTPPTASDPFASGEAPGSAPPAAAAKSDNDDEFDAFFRDRTAAP